MDIINLKFILETLHSVGISEMVLSPTVKNDKPSTLVRGSNRERSVVVYHEIEDLVLTEVPMGVQSVNGLLSRISLFDESKASIELVQSHDIVGTVNIKQGRKKATYRCADPNQLSAPNRIPGDLAISEASAIIIPSSQVDFLGQAISSMSLTGNKEERTITMQVTEEGSLDVTIVDGEDDSFKEIIEDVGGSPTEKGTWDVSSFSRVMKRASENSEVSFRRIFGSDVGEVEDKAVVFSITEYKIAVFAVADLDILVVPNP